MLSLFSPKMFVPVCLPSVLETPFYHTFDKSRCHLIELHQTDREKRLLLPFCGGTDAASLHFIVSVLF